MAGAPIELATGYVSLVPSMQGAEASIAKQLIPAATGAGESAGVAGGSAVGMGMKTAMLKYIGPAALAALFVASVKGLYDVGATFDDLTDTIRTGTGATGDALNGLVGVAKNVGSKVPADWDKISVAVADLNTRLGLSGSTLETVASQYLEAGRILGEDVDVQKTSAAFSAFKIKGDDVVGAMDTLFQVSQATGVSMNDLASSVQANAPAMQTLGFSFEETASLAGSLDKAGLNSTATMAAMSKGLVTLAKDGEDPQAAFARITGEIDALVESGDKAGAIDLAAGIFGTRGANQFVGAVESGTLALDDLVAGTGATTDTILGVGAETADFAESWKIVKNNAQLALEPLGSAVFGALGDAFKGMVGPMQSFSDWMQKNPTLVKGLAIVLGTVAIAIGVVTAAQWLLNSALLANPIGLIIVAVAALVAGLVYFFTQTKLGQQIWETVTTAIGAAWSWLWTTILEPYINAFIALWTWLWENVIKPVVDFIVAYVQMMGATYTWLWENAVKPAMDAIGAAWSWLYDNVITPVVDGAKLGIERLGAVFTWLYDNAISPAITNVTGAFDTLKNAFASVQTFIDEKATLISDTFTAIATTIQDAFRGVFNKIAGFWNDSVGALSFKAPDWVPGIGGKGFDVPNIPLLASGGTAVRSGLSVVGDAGPELLHMPRGASVLPLDYARDLASSSGSNITRADLQAFAHEIATSFTQGSARITASGIDQAARRAGLDSRAGLGMVAV